VERNPGEAKSFPGAGGHNSALMKKIRAAVIGVGYLGRFHAQKYAQAAGCELLAVVDSRQDVREKVAAEVGTQAVADYHELLGEVDAVSVVTPTPAHFPITRDFLSAGAHVLVEKPITETLAEARELIELAARHKRVLQVGHLERFNAAILAAEPHLRSPRFVECHRLAPYRERGTDVNVVLDLMIHDIDIVQTIVGAPVTSIDAVGTPVFSEEIDIANARIHFANGCVANATASRVSMKTERKMRIFEDDAYLSLDLQQKILTLIRKRTAAEPAGPLPVTIEEQNLDQGDALKAEIESFLDCIRSGRAPVVSGEAGLMALETAMRITEQVRQSLAARKAHAGAAEAGGTRTGGPG
jgi:predicted dehydrogenase